MVGLSTRCRTGDQTEDKKLNVSLNQSLCSPSVSGLGLGLDDPPTAGVSELVQGRCTNVPPVSVRTRSNINLVYSGPIRLVRNEAESSFGFISH